MNKILSNLFKGITFLLVISTVEMSSNLFAQTWTSIDGGGTTGINSSTATSSEMPSCVAYNNELYAIWTEVYSAANNQVHIKKYNGTTWVNAGISGQSKLNASTNFAGNPKLATYNGNLYAAWNEGGSGGDPLLMAVHVMKYNGTSWAFAQDYTVGQNRANINYALTGNASDVDIIVFNNELYATWSEWANMTYINQVRVSKFNGSVWTSVDGNGTTGLNYNTGYKTYPPKFCVHNNKLYLSWTELNAVDTDPNVRNQLRARVYNGGSSWSFIDGDGLNGLNYDVTKGADQQTLVSCNNKLYMFWQEAPVGKTQPRIRAKQYDEINGWTTVPGGLEGWYNSPSLTGGSRNPSSIAYNNLLYVAWDENPAMITWTPRFTISQVKVVSFDGTTKTYIDGGKYVGGLNLDTLKRAYDPMLTEFNGDLYALWKEDNTTTSNEVPQIRVKKYPLPGITTSVTVPANGCYKASQTLDITVNFNKVETISGGTPYIPITLNTGGTVNATYISGSGTKSFLFRYTIVSGNVDSDGITIGSSIVLPSGCTLKDAAALDAALTLNSMGSTTAVLVDAVAPTITSGILASSNGYIDVTFSEGVYGASDGTTALSASKFSLTFTGNGGNATNATVSSVKKSDNAVEGSASVLTGGETTVRVFLTITGTPSGVETIEIKPANGTSVYDKAGNAASVTQTSGVKVLNDIFPPTLSSVARTDNTHLIVTLSKNCINLTKANDGGFTVCETGAPATTYAVTAITQGADASHVVLALADLAISGKEGVTVKYVAGGNGTVQDNAGNAMATNSTGVSVSAWDVAAPSVTGGTLASSNGFIDIFFNEGVYGASDGVTPLSASKFSRAFVQNTGTATNVTISSVKKNDNTVEGSASALTGGETTVRIFLTVTGTPSGAETIEVKPANGTSIYDKAGNAASVSETTGIKTLNDKLAPTVSITTTASEPTTTSPIPVTITFSETVTDFLDGDIVVTNGSKSGFSGNSSTYTVNITPSTTGMVTVNVAAGVAIDGAGNGNTVATQLSRTFNYIVPKVSFTAAAQSSTNESGTMTITAQLSEATGATITVPFTVNGTSTATSGTDYSISANPISIAAGSTTGTTTITIVTDALNEDNETIVVDMGTPTNATKGIITTHTATITNDDAVPTVTFTAASQASVDETGTMTMIAQLSAASGKAVTVPFTVNGTSTATSGTDYSISASPISISAGSTTGTATITIVTDALNEDNETIVVDMGTPTNATKGTTIIHTATITDDDAMPTVTFTSVSQTSVGETGAMTITAQLSTASSKAVTVPFTVNGMSTATSGTDYSISASPISISAGSTTGTATITIATDALDENNETVVIDMGTPSNATKGTTTTHTATITNDDSKPVVTSAQSFSINENSISGTVVGTVVATDPDAGTTFGGWTITVNANPDGDVSNAFAINPATGKITVFDAGDFDREVSTSLTIKVTVTDGTNISVEETVEININDLKDVAPVITAAQVFYVTEQAPNGITVGTALATDGDVTATTFQNWTITAGNSGGYFAINSSTGAITVADNTGLNTAVSPSFTLTLTVSDGTNTSSAQTVSIVVSAVNDDNPVVTSAQSFAINENSNNSTAVGQVLATDPDYGTLFQGWAITAGNSNNAFAIDPATGAITVNSKVALDREAVSSFSLSVTVSDGVNTSAAETVTINLTDVNDVVPVIAAVQPISIDENLGNGSIVGTLVATDGDVSATTYSSWTITNGNTGNAFAINPSTGAITVNQLSALDFETTATFTLLVTVSDGVNTSAAETITINLNNLNDNTPEITSTLFEIDENSPKDFFVGKVETTDMDGNLNALTVTIKSGNTGDAFAYHNAMGNLVVNTVAAVNFEVNPLFNLELEVSDGALSSTKTVQVKLKDVVETGINEQLFSSISAYPNPCSGSLFIEVPVLVVISDITLIDVNGKQIYREQPSAAKGKHTLDMEAMPQGIYFVVMQGEGAKKILRIVKQ